MKGEYKTHQSLYKLIRELNATLYTQPYTKGFERLLRACRMHCKVEFNKFLSTSIYSPTDRTIYLRNSCSKILIHEFVHFLQDKHQTGLRDEITEYVNEIIAETIAFKLTHAKREFSMKYIELYKNKIYKKGFGYPEIRINQDITFYLKEVRKTLLGIDKYMR